MTCPSPASADAAAKRASAPRGAGATADSRPMPLPRPRPCAGAWGHRALICRAQTCTTPTMRGLMPAFYHDHAPTPAGLSGNRSHLRPSRVRRRAGFQRRAGDRPPTVGQSHAPGPESRLTGRRHLPPTARPLHTLGREPVSPNRPVRSVGAGPGASPETRLCSPSRCASGRVFRNPEGGSEPAGMTGLNPPVRGETRRGLGAAAPAPRLRPWRVRRPRTPCRGPS